MTLVLHRACSGTSEQGGVRLTFTQNTGLRWSHGLSQA